MCRVLTNHAVNGAEEHGALSGCRGLTEVLQHQRAVAEDIDKLTEVEHPHLLQMLPLLVCGGGAEQQEKKGSQTFQVRLQILTGGTWSV